MRKFFFDILVGSGVLTLGTGIFFVGNFLFIRYWSTVYIGIMTATAILMAFCVGRYVRLELGWRKSAKLRKVA